MSKDQKKGNFKLVVDNAGEVPAVGSKYWTFYLNTKTGWNHVFEATWKDGMIDRKRFNLGYIFESKAVAEGRLKQKQAVIKAARAGSI